MTSTPPAAPTPLDRFCRGLDRVSALALALMAAMVFGNVVLRYGFNSGILISEELSRFLFVWMTFIGAVVVLREHGHLGMDSVIKLLPLNGARVAKIISDALIIVCCIYIMAGTWLQHDVNMENLSPVITVPMEYVYSVAYISGISMIAVMIASIITTAMPGARDPRQSLFVDAEEEAALKRVDSVSGKSNP